MLLAKKILLLPLLAACFLPPPADGENAGCDKIVFIKRNTYDSNHYYTEFINASWRPGRWHIRARHKIGAAVPVFKGLENGVVGRFDLSFDAKKIVFSFKKSKDEGYRIFEGDIASGEIRQLTFPEKDEDALAEKFSTPFYRKGTDDLDPCYLPDGGIAFVSTRPKFGVLCDPNDIFTVTLLYRMDADGKNIKQLSFGALSENSPVIMEDGRILYTRWEYVDKGASAVKALWAVRPDGTGSAEIYGLDIALPADDDFRAANSRRTLEIRFLWHAALSAKRPRHDNIRRRVKRRALRQSDEIYNTPNGHSRRRRIPF